MKTITVRFIFPPHIKQPATLAEPQQLRTSQRVVKVEGKFSANSCPGILKFSGDAGGLETVQKSGSEQYLRVATAQQFLHCASELSKRMGVGFESEEAGECVILQS